MLSALIECHPGLFMKLEMNNPGGSHKFRAADHIVKTAIATGLITPGKTTVIEKTGGNFGFGLLAACHRHGVPVDLAIGLGFSARKKELLACLGANLIGQQMLLDGATPKEVVLHHLEDQHRLGKRYFYTDQFQNTLGIEAHSQGAGKELSEQLRQVLPNNQLTFVGCAGTGASFTGITRALLDHGFDVQAHLVEPLECDSRAGRFAEHRLEGMAVGVVPPFLDWARVDAVHQVNLTQMLASQRWAYLNNGLYIGNSSAACLAVARQLSQAPEHRGRAIISIAYDSGLWYQDLSEQRAA